MSYEADTIVLIKELHWQQDLDGYGNPLKPICYECKAPYPCSTIKLIEHREQG